MNPRPSILITIDVEDWFQVENLRPWISPLSWDSYALRVEQNTHRLLDLFDQASLERNIVRKNRHITNEQRFDAQDGKIRATFFILGWIAQRAPSLIREIHNRGHEVASHGYSHTMCNQLEIDDLQAELSNSKQMLEDIIDTDVKGYRAPSFSIDDKTIELIKKVGYQYDSSFNSFSKHGRYGTITLNGYGKKGIAYRLNPEFSEIPISNLKLYGKIVPWGGGGYFRLLPLFVFQAGIRRILKQANAFMFYMHPWEIDAGQPRVKEAAGFSAWRHYLNLDKTYSRLSKMIKRFKHCDFITCSQYLENQNR